MKTKIIVAVLALLVVIGVGGFFAYQYSQKEFFCSSTGRIHKPFATVAQACDKYKDEAERYENCVKKFEKTQKAFKAGKCMELIREVVKIDDSTCNVTYSTDKSSYFSYSCDPRSPEVAKKIREMYIK